MVVAQFFLGIGAQKAGTTWLATQLFEHPEILGSHPKELHVLDSLYSPDVPIDGRARAVERRDGARRHLTAWQTAPLEPGETDERRSFMSAFKQQRVERLERLVEVFDAPDEAEALIRYRDFFTSAARPEHRAFGEITPSYALLPKRGFEGVLDAFPDARLIFLLRDPVDRFRSAMAHRAKYGVDAAFDAVGDARTRLGNRNDLLRGRYESTLDMLDAIVPASQLLVVFYENLFDPGKDEFRRVTDYLGVSPRDVDLDRPINVGDRMEFPDDLRRDVARAHASTYRAIEERFGELPDAWRRNASELLDG